MSTLDAPSALPGARLLFSLDPAVAHLNHGSFGAVPVSVQRAQQRLRDEMEANPNQFYGPGIIDRIAHARRHLAGFLGADPDGCALVSNVTAATAVVLASLDLRRGDEVVRTNHGYGAVAIALAEACRHTGARAVTVPLPLTAGNAEIVAAIRAAVNQRTRLVIVDQISSPTARLFPAAAVTAAVRDRGAAVLVDAAHTPGLLHRPAAGVDADFWVGNLHKWAYAPRGSALLSVAQRWRTRVRPLVPSWCTDDGFPGSLEYQGTVDYTSWLAAPTGVFALRALGPELVREHNAALAGYGQHVLGAALGLAPSDLPGAVNAGRPGAASADPPDAGPTDPAGAAAPALPMRIVPLPEGVATDQAAALALRRRIADELATELAINAWQGRGLLRLSAQVYNRAEEYERLAERLPGFLARR